MERRDVMDDYSGPNANEVRGQCMNASTLVDVTLTAEEARITRRALLQFIVEEGKCAMHLRSVGAEQMGNAVNVDIKTAAQVLKVLGPNPL